MFSVSEGDVILICFNGTNEKSILLVNARGIRNTLRLLCAQIIIALQQHTTRLRT